MGRLRLCALDFPVSGPAFKDGSTAGFVPACLRSGDFSPAVSPASKILIPPKGSSFSFLNAFFLLSVSS